MNLRCVIIDDEPLARKGLREYVQDVDFLQLAGEYDNPMRAVDTILQQKADLLFLDIEMPKISGPDFIRSMPQLPMVIFTTAYPQHAVEGFELNAVDYLVKPFSFDRFCKAVMKARRLKESSAAPVAVDPAAGENFFFVKCDNKLVRILFDEILFIEALQNYIAVHTPARKHITYLTIHAIQEYLPAERFIRTHKSYIVAIAKIESISGNDIKIGPHHVPISRTEKDSVMRVLLQNRLLKR